MASLLLPELGMMGGFILATISRKMLGDMHCGITSASKKNRRQQTIGSFF